MRASTHPRPFVPAPRRPLPIRRRTAPSALQLARADLHQTDLRGLDLTGADLRGANLTGVQTGLRRGWEVILVAGSLLVSVAIGVLTGRVGHLVAQLLVSPDPVQRAVGIVVASQLLLVLAAAAWKGIRFAVERVLLPLMVFEMVSVAMAVLIGGSGLGAVAALGIGLCLVLLLALAILARAMAGVTGPLMFALVAVSGALAGRALGGGSIALILALSAMLLSKRALAEAADFPWTSRLAVLTACAGGTSLRNADLRGARLDRALLSCTDLRGAQLEGTTFDQAKIELCAFDDVHRAKVSEQVSLASCYFEPATAERAK